LRDTLQQIDLIHRLVDEYPERLELVHRASDIIEIFNRDKIAVIPSIEGLHQIGNSSSVLRNYYRLGIRCATLAHNKNNKYAGSAVRLSYRKMMQCRLIKEDFCTFAADRAIGKW
jgi:membrane dipeptidase